MKLNSHTFAFIPTHSIFRWKGRWTAKLALPQLALFSGLLALTAPGAQAQPIAVTYGPPPANAPILHTTFVDWNSLVVKTSKNGEGRAVFDNPTPTLEKFEMHITTLLPGKSSHPVHQHPWEEMLLIKDGDVEMSINGKTTRAGPGYLIFLASHDPHNLKNIGDHPATYYVINFCTDLVHTVADRPASEQAVPGKLPSSVIDCEHLPAKPTKTGSRITILESPTLTFLSLGSHITTLNAGQTTGELTDSGDELFVVKSGLLEATINGVAARLASGSFFYCAPNDKRMFKSLGGAPASYQVIKIVSARTPKTTP